MPSVNHYLDLEILVWAVSGLIVGGVCLGYRWLRDNDWLPWPWPTYGLREEEDLTDLATREERVLERVMELQRHAPPKPFNMPDVFKTAHGRRRHAVRPWRADANGGSLPLASYCGVETRLEDLEGEGLVDCQTCLKAIVANDDERRDMSSLPKSKPNPVKRPTAWDKMNDDEF